MNVSGLIQQLKTQRRAIDLAISALEGIGEREAPKAASVKPRKRRA